MPDNTFRLNLGVGNRPISGYIGVDILRGPHTKIRADVASLPVKTDSVAAVYGSDILEHFPREKTVEVLKEWHRVLVPGGVAVLKTPNIRTIAEWLVQGRIDAAEASRKIYANQGTPFDFHYAGFDGQLLRTLVEAAGFRVVHHLEKMDGDDWSNQSLRAVKP